MPSNSLGWQKDIFIGVVLLIKIISGFVWYDYKKFLRVSFKKNHKKKRLYTSCFNAVFNATTIAEV
jgi:hypothetical protein